jgi:hypothetical protein
MQIDSSGNATFTEKIGIGTTSPTAPLDVFGVRAGRNWSITNRATIRLDANGASYPSDMLFGHTAAANQTSWTGAYWSLSSRGSTDANKFHFYRGGGNPTGSSEQVLMTLDPNLRVGIGTTSPQTKLHVQHSSISPSSVYGTLIVEQSNESSIGILGTTYSSVYFGDAQAPYTGGIVYQHSDNHLEFRTNGNSERMRIDSAGNVGIGLTPNVSYSKLQIKTPSSAYGLDLVGRDAGSNSESQITFWNSTQATVLASIYNIFKDLYFYTNGDNRMIITSDGKVGIGVTSPQSKLQVAYPGNVNGGSMLLGQGGSGTSKWSFLAGTHYNQASGSGNGAGSAGVALIGSFANSTTNVVYIGGGPYEINAATQIKFYTNSTNLSTQGGTHVMNIANNGSIRFNTYDGTNKTGTPTYLLGTDASGNVVKTLSTPGGDPGPYLPLAGGTMTGTNGVVFPDSFKLKLGTGNDAQIKHDGSHLFIDNSVGNSYLRNTSTGSILLRNSTGGDIQFDNEFAGNILFNTSNIERMRIDSSGNVGVGTTNPNTGKLVVTGAAYSISSSGQSLGGIDLRANANGGAGSYSAGISFGGASSGRAAISGVMSSASTDGDRQGLAFFTHGSGTGSADSVERMRLDSSGNVGIGTTSPDGNLEVITSTIVSGASDTVNNVLIGLQAANRPTIILDTADTTYTNRTWNITNVGSAGKLFIGRNGLDVMVMDNSGNVGIGTTSPVTNASYNKVLQINAASGVGAVLKLTDTTTGAAAADGFELLQYGTSSYLINREAGDMNFRTSNLQRIIIQAGGNVGIGTTSPSNKLAVCDSNGTGLEIAPNDTSEQVVVLSYDRGQTAYRRINFNALDYIFRTSATERMRITSAGTLLLRSGAFPTNQDSPFLYRIGGGSLAIGSATETGSGAYVALYTNSSERMRIDSSGSIGVGTTPPTTNVHPQLFIGSEGVLLGGSLGALDIGNNLYYNSGWKNRTTGAGSLLDFDALGNFVFYTSASAAADSAATLSERMRIDSSGAVLIGGQPKIDTATKLQVGGNDSGVTSIWSNADDIVFEHNTNLGLTFATPNDAAATIAFADPQSVQAGWIQYLHDVDAMRFGTNGNNERMRIDSSGRILLSSSLSYNFIGSNTSDASDNERLFISGGGDASAGRGGLIAFYGNEYTGAGGDVSIQAGRTTDANISFFTGDTTTTERMRIDSLGRVGIGTTSPGAPLDVNGNVYVRGTGVLYADTLAGYTAGVITLNASTNFIVPSGRVGIGTTGPTAPLHILGGSNDTIDETTANLKVQGGGGNGTMFGTIASSPYTSYIQSAYVVDTSLAQYNLALNPIGGNVGIGLTNPTTHLEVVASQSNSSIRAGGLEMQSYAVNNSWYAENLYYNGGWKLRSNGYATQMYMQDGKITFNRFVTGNAGDFVTPYPTMILNSNGKVGINTTSVSAQLQVTSTGDNGSAGYGNYGILTTAGGSNQATIGAMHDGDGYANLNLGSNVSSSNVFWHISKRVSNSNDFGGNNGLDYFYYNGSGFTNVFGFSTTGYFKAADGATFGGTVTAATYYKSSGTSAVLGTNSSGEVLLRPTAWNLSTAQSSFTTTLATIGTNATFAGNADISGQVTVGTSNSIFAENVLRFNSTGTAFIDHTTVGATINFRVSNSAILDTTALTIEGSGNSTFAGDVKGATFNSIENAASGGFPTSKDYLLAGTGDRGGGLIVNDISGARHGIAAGGYDLTFSKETNNGSGTLSHDIWMRANASSAAGDVSSLDFFKPTNFTGNATFSGDISTSTVQISNGQSYNENIRMFPSTSNDYSSLVLGAVSGTSGTGYGQWTLVRYPYATHSHKFSIRHSSSDIMVMTTGGDTTFAGSINTSGSINLTNAGVNTIAASNSSNGYLRFLVDQQGVALTLNADTTSTFGGIIYAVDGNKGAPGISFANDTDTGIFRDSSDKLAFATGANTRMIIESNGEVGINQPNPSATLHLRAIASNGVPFKLEAHPSTSVSQMLIYATKAYNSTDAWYNLVCEAGDGSGGQTNTLIIERDGDVRNKNNSYGQISDIRLKENITDATPKLEDIKKLKVKNFNLIGDDLKQIGLIAQEVEEVFPGLVKEDKQPDVNGEEGGVYKSVKYSVLVPMLIKAMQEQQEQIDELKKQINN